MTPAARAAAAIEVLTDIDARRRPAADAMKDWGLAHRFAGSGDRAAISSLVYDALRKKSSSAWIMGEPSPRAEMLGALRQTRDLDVEAIAALFSGEGHAPEKLTEAERARLAAADLSGAPAHVVGDFPEWLDAATRGELWRVRSGRGQGARRAGAGRPAREPSQGHARQGARARLLISRLEPTPFSPVGLRIAMRQDGRAPPLASDPAYVKGLVEVQDEGSQLAALLAEAKPGMQVLDLCAGAGGKTLALAAAMENQGQIYAADPDPQAPRADLRPARPLGRAQCPGAGAEGPSGRARRPQRAVRSGADRRAVHRLRRLAAQPRRQVAHPPRRARAAHQGSGRDAGKRLALRQARRAHRLRDLLCPAGRERGPDRRRSCAATTICCQSTPPRRRVRQVCQRSPSISRRWVPAFVSARERPARTAFMSRP